MSKKTKIVVASSIIAAILIAIIIALVLILGGDGSYRSINVYESSGNVKIIRENEYEPYKDMRLRSNDEIITNEGYITLALDNDKYIKLLPKSKARLLCSEYDTRLVRLKLYEGSTIIELKHKLDMEDEFIVDSPSSSMAIRGTVVEISVKRGNDGDLISYNLLEGELGIRTYKKEGENIILSEAPLKENNHLELFIKKNLLVDTDSIKKEEKNPDNKRNTFNTIEDLIENEKDITITKKNISKEDKDKIYDEIKKFNRDTNSLISINSRFRVEATNLFDQVSYDSADTFEVNLRPDTIKGAKFKYWLVNGENVGHDRNPFNLKIKGHNIIEAVFEFEKVFDVELDNCYIDGIEAAPTVPIVEGRRVTIRPLIDKPVKEFIVDGKSIPMDMDYIELDINSDTSVKCVLYDCKVGETIVKLDGVKALNYSNGENELFLKKGSEIIVSKLNDPNSAFMGFNVNNKDIDNNKDTIKLTIDSRSIIKGKYQAKGKALVKCLNGKINYEGSEATLNIGDLFVASFDNPENNNVKGLLLNNKLITHTTGSYILRCDGDMTIEFVLGEDMRSVKVVNENPELGTLLIDGKEVVNHELKLAKGALININAQAKAGYIYGGTFDRAKTDIGLRECLLEVNEGSYMVNTDITLYVSFMPSYEQYKVVDEGGKLDMVNNIIAAYPNTREDIDFTALKLYHFDKVLNKYVKTPKSDYRIIVSYSAATAWAESDVIPEYISLNEISTYKPGLYMINFESINYENSRIDTLASVVVNIGDYMDKPEKALTLTLDNDKLDVIMASDYGLITNIKRGGKPNRYIYSDGLNILSEAVIDYSNVIRINEGMFDGAIITSPDGDFFKGFTYEVAEGFTLYYQNPKRDIVEYPSGGLIPLNNNTFEMLLMPSYLDPNTYGHLGEKQAYSMPLTFALTNYSGVIGIGVNNRAHADGFTSPFYKTVALEDFEQESEPEVGKKNLSYNINMIDQYLTLDGKIEEMYHLDSKGTISFKIKTEHNIIDRMGNTISKNNLGIVELSLKPEEKLFQLENIKGNSIEYIATRALLIYKIRIQVPDYLYTLEFFYEIGTPNMAKNYYDYVLDTNGAEAASRLYLNDEEMGYDKELYSYYFTVSGGGYDTPEYKIPAM